MTEVQHVVGSVVEGGAFCRGANSSCNLNGTCSIDHDADQFFKWIFCINSPHMKS